MSLAGYQPERVRIDLTDKHSFNVGGLSLSDLTVLLRTHFDDLDVVADKFENIEQVKPEEFQAIAMSLLGSMPGFCANVIALSAGEGDGSTFQGMPFPVQVKALLEIGRMTFAEVGGVKKGLELVMALLKESGLGDKMMSARKTVKKNAR